MRGGILAAGLFLVQTARAGEESFPRDFRALLKSRAYDEAARLAESLPDAREESHARDARLLRGYLNLALENASGWIGEKVKVCGIKGTLVRVEGEEITIRTRGMELTQPFGRLRPDEVVALAEIDPPDERFAMRALFYHAEGDKDRATKEIRGAKGGEVAERVRKLLSVAPAKKPAAKPATKPAAKPATAGRRPASTQKRRPARAPADAFENRTPEGRRECVEAHGGTDATENAVEAALGWLAAHQEPDGRWDGEKYEGQNTDPGITGLAMMAFLSAGYTHLEGRYKTTVENAIEWMATEQDRDGSIGRGYQRGFGYHHSISALALAEAYGMTKDPHLKREAQKAVDYSVNVHQCPGSGWRYSARQAPCTSVTGWFVQQLGSARDAGLRVPNSGFAGAAGWFQKVTQNGRVSYQEGRGSSVVMTALGMVARQSMGWRRNDLALNQGANWVMSKLPDWNSANFYYWYYGSIAMFQMGGKRWDTWNDALKGALVPHQRRGGDEEGSWDPVGAWCTAGGRVMSTAMGALCLETYYRYPPAWK